MAPAPQVAGRRIGSQGLIEPRQLLLDAEAAVQHHQGQVVAAPVGQACRQARFAEPAHAGQQHPGVGVAVEDPQRLLQLPATPHEQAMGGHRHRLAKQVFLQVVGRQQRAFAPAADQRARPVAAAAEPQAGVVPMAAELRIGRVEQGAAGLGERQGQGIARGEPVGLRRRWPPGRRPRRPNR
jgi:hypothetical protein